MDSLKILNADVLDIIFEGRNKDYGAYQLRKTYNRRLTYSLVGMAALFLLLSAGYVLSKNSSDSLARHVITPPDMHLMELEKEKIDPPPPIPPKPPEPKKVETIKYTNIKIVKDEEVPPDEKPPEVDKLEDVKIGTIKQEGVKDLGIIAPPIETKGTGVIETPKKVEEDKPFTKVEIPSEYPGGMAAWQRYLYKTLRYPQEAQDNGIQGTVVVQFIVDREGKVSDVVAISGPKELREEAVRVIRKSGNWTAAIQNGRKVKSYKKQPIGFRMADE